MTINMDLLLHPSDKAAMTALKAIPGFSQLTKAYMSIMNERQYKILNMSGKVQLSERQMPEIYRLLPPICEKLGIEVPELYMELNVVPNAYTFGDTHPFIVLTSGLLETVPAELLPTVIAHECGHIACRHTLYTTMANLLLNGLDQFITGLGTLLTVPMKLTFAYWMRCSEFSADRASILCDGGAEKLTEMCFRLAGGDKDIQASIDIEAFVEQATDYRAMIRDSKWNKTLEFLVLMPQSHPLLAVRALEGREWAASEQFGRLRKLTDYRVAGIPQESCDIPAPEASKALVGRNFREVQETLSAAGFTNIALLRVIDEKYETRDGAVLLVTAGEGKAFDRLEWLDRDSTISIFYYEHPTQEELEAAHPGQIRLPAAARDYIGRDYSAVYLEMEKAGFRHIETMVVQVKKSWLTRENTVYKISIAGNDRFEKGSWVDKESTVQIIYQIFAPQA